jgi:tetratricopeptide (TPR) repeat protein
MKVRNWKALALAAAVAAGLAGTGEALAQRATQARPPLTSQQAMFEYLLAEVALQRGDTAVALGAYLDLARQLREAPIARRAVEAAIRARAFEPALEAAALLVELEPDGSLGREILSSLLANNGNLDQAVETLDKLIAKQPDKGLLIAQVNHFLARYPDKARVLEGVRKLVSRYPGLPESHYALAVAALLAGQDAMALDESRAALAARPGWELAVVLQAQVVRKSDPAAVEALYRGFLAANPGSKDVRMQYARELATAKQFAAARDQFREVERLSPQDAQVAYAIGLLALQIEDYGDAEAAFKRALELKYKDENAVYLSLGQVFESRKQVDEAIKWYAKVEAGDEVRAKLKIATLIAKHQGLAAGRDYLRAVVTRTTEDRIALLQVEAQLLREAREFKQSYELLDVALEEFPDSHELLYDRAMAAERIDRLDVVEADLKRVIAMKPDYAHAYNALGYTLAEKTDRLTEAMALIQQAVKLSPDDPFILDSLGWVHYRLGNLDESVKYLQSAYSMRSDPEIAAHLGEVLWARGSKDEARKVWSAALSVHPDHESLLAVMQKYKP